ncbi:Hypothetical predicted protein [Scomber scombrus]
MHVYSLLPPYEDKEEEEDRARRYICKVELKHTTMTAFSRLIQYQNTKERVNQLQHAIEEIKLKLVEVQQERLRAEKEKTNCNWVNCFRRKGSFLNSLLVNPLQKENKGAIYKTETRVSRTRQKVSLLKFWR